MSEIVRRDQPSKERSAARVTILDAVDLDSEVFRILKDQLIKAASFFPPGVLGKWEPEIDAILRYTLWRFSMYAAQATFGQQMLGIKYSSAFSKKKAVRWALLTIGCRYIREKVPNITTQIPDVLYRNKINMLVSWVEVILQVANIVNLLIFLHKGKYPTVTDRIVNLQPVSATSQSRTVGYSYITRELLWHGILELLMFSLPLINYRNLQRQFLNLFGTKRYIQVKPKTLVYTMSTKCIVCQETPVLPHHIGCAHVFCYFCLYSNRTADMKFECPSCGYVIDNANSVQLVTAAQITL